MSQIEEKKRLLEQFLNLSTQIYDLFSAKNIDEALRLISRKDMLINNLKRLKNIQDESYSELRQKIKEQEEKNIEIANELFADIKQELAKTNRSVKLSNIYSIAQEKGSIVDILE